MSFRDLVMGRDTTRADSGIQGKRSRRYQAKGYTRNDVRLYCARGARLPQAVLTEAQVAEIRRVYKPFCAVNGGTALAKRFNVHQNTIWKVTSRDSWAHVMEAA